MCRKRAYTKREAKRAKTALECDTGGVYAVYLCTKCLKYHITTQVKF